VSSLGVLAAFVALVDPPRAGALVAPALWRTGRAVAVTAAAVAAAAGIVLAAVHEPILDLLSVSAPTFRIGAGLVITVLGLRSLLLAPEPWTEGVAGGRLAVLVPIAFPVLITPELAVAAVSFGADEGTATTVGGVVLALGLVAIVGSWRRLAEDGPRPAWLVPLGRLLGAGAVVVGVARLVSGIFDV
jgi:small neutral amino acid transporter SnatA (MarC family)